MWHRLLLFLRIRSEFDWAPPALGPEVNHPYIQHPALMCCAHCGGGPKHAIHHEPFDARRTAEILATLDPEESPTVRAWREDH
jgi:hypothetical protein